MLIRSGSNCQMFNQKEKDICPVKKEKHFFSPDFEYQKMVQEGNGAAKRPTPSVINDCFFFYATSIITNMTAVSMWLLTCLCLPSK